MKNSLMQDFTKIEYLQIHWIIVGQDSVCGKVKLNKAYKLGNERQKVHEDSPVISLSDEL